MGIICDNMRYKMAIPIVSVIVPVYKTEKYLDRCIQSIVNQTYKELEILLVDDGSPDHSPEICDEWAEKDDRIKVIHIKNSGVANARNAALKIAQGDYIAFVDSDDYIEPDIYERLLAILTNGHADIAVCDYQINDEQRGNEVIKIFGAKDALKFIATGDYKYGVLWNKLYTKKVLQGVLMPELKCSQDLPFNYFAFKHARIIVESSLKLYHYFQNEQSTVHSGFGNSKIDAVKARKIIIDDAQGTELFPYAVKGYILSCFVFINGIIQYKKCGEFYPELRKEILQYRKFVFHSSFFNRQDKAKILLFWLFPRLYGLIIKKIR